jgi:hypothetical protein
MNLLQRPCVRILMRRDHSLKRVTRKRGSKFCVYRSVVRDNHLEGRLPLQQRKPNHEQTETCGTWKIICFVRLIVYSFIILTCAYNRRPKKCLYSLNAAAMQCKFIVPWDHSALYAGLIIRHGRHRQPSTHSSSLVGKCKFQLRSGTGSPSQKFHSLFISITKMAKNLNGSSTHDRRTIL